MFKKRAAKKEEVDLGLEQIQDKDNKNGSDDEENVVVRTKKKVKPNPTDEEQNDRDNKVQELIDQEMNDLKYKSNENMMGNRKDLATVYNEIDTDEIMDAHAIAIKRMELSQQKRDGKIASDVYLGRNYTTQYTMKSEEQISKSKITGSMGPVRAPANVRMTCRFDFDPSLCKDYHNTGYCVFGDSCLYLHDRGDYKNGFEQEQEWQRDQKRKQQAIQNGEEEDSEADEVQTKLEDFQVTRICQICDGKLRYPIKTLCNHFFCEGCAIKNYATSKTCYVCDRNTQGVFQDATNTLTILEKERKEEKQRLRQTTNSKKALSLLEDTEESDDSQNNFVPKSKKFKKKSNQKKEKKQAEVSVERTYIDENGIEITETIIQHQSDNDREEDNNSDEGGDEESKESDRENNNQNNENEEDEEEIGQINNNASKDQYNDERDIQVALNQMNKSKQKNRSFKPSASDWLIQ